jgi:hypothetical protein
MNEKDKNVRREKVDAADAKDARETYLPGQIPVEEAETQEMENPEERQPDPVQAEQAVNPELQGAGRDRRKPEPAATPAEDRRKR